MFLLKIKIILFEFALTDFPWWLISLSSSSLRPSMYVCKITWESQ